MDDRSAGWRLALLLPEVHSLKSTIPLFIYLVALVSSALSDVAGPESRSAPPRSPVVQVTTEAAEKGLPRIKRLTVRGAEIQDVLRLTFSRGYYSLTGGPFLLVNSGPFLHGN